MTPGTPGERSSRVILSSYLLDEENNQRIEEAAARLGLEFLRAPTERDERIAHIDERIAEADIFFGGRLTKEQWEQAKRLRWIHVPWAGVNSLFAVTAIRESGITITNASGVMSHGVADQVMASLLLIARDLPRQIRAQPRGEWLPYTVEGTTRRSLSGSTIGIIGYGAIGSAIARRARAFEMRVVATRRTVTPNEPPPPELDALYSTEHLADLLSESDYVVITLPLTDETRGMIGQSAFEAMKSSAWLVNIARGEIIREDELITALRNGTIAGAALDVFKQEPLPTDSPLWTMENVIITPHSAGGYDGFWGATTELFVDNLERYCSGGELRNVVEHGRGY